VLKLWKSKKAEEITMNRLTEAADLTEAEAETTEEVKAEVVIMAETTQVTEEAVVAVMEITEIVTTAAAAAMPVEIITVKAVILKAQFKEAVKADLITTTGLKEIHPQTVVVAMAVTTTGLKWVTDPEEEEPINSKT
jgi:hypothetical protein